MAKKSQSTTKPIGLALMVIGAGLAYWGYQMSGSVSSQITQAISGAASEPVMIRYIGGAASFFVGLYLFLKK
jgi:hypothetical protein